MDSSKLVGTVDNKQSHIVVDSSNLNVVAVQEYLTKNNWLIGRLQENQKEFKFKNPKFCDHKILHWTRSKGL